jgi:hypothetical protein
MSRRYLRGPLNKTCRETSITLARGEELARPNKTTARGRSLWSSRVAAYPPPVCCSLSPLERWGEGAQICRMIKRVLFAVLVFTALVSLASAQDSNVSVDMIGIGSMSCAHWRSTKEHLLEGTVWIYGFWTGLNYVAAASDQAQAKIDVAATMSEVEKTCAQQMSQTLASAVWTTYIGSKR